LDIVVLLGRDTRLFTADELSWLQELSSACEMIHVTTSFTVAPTCIPGRVNTIQVTPTNPYTVKNTVGLNYVETQVEQLTPNPLENFINDVVFNATHSIATRYKQRVVSVIEFVDIGTPGYLPGVDTLVQESDMNTLMETWGSWSTNGDTFTSKSSKNTFTAVGNIKRTAGLCSVKVPNVVDDSLIVDWRTHYIRAGTKLCIRMSYTMYQDVTPINSKRNNGVDFKTSFPGDMSGSIANEFTNPHVNINGNDVSLITNIISNGNPTQPSYTFYYTPITTNQITNSTFSIHLMQPIQCIC